ncbi:MAG: hypothetical protein R3F23_02260 [Verrucomicrobiia bacterium]
MAITKAAPKESNTQPPKLQILRNGVLSNSLDIANFEDGSLSPTKTIGVVKNGKKYLYEKDSDKILEVVKGWQTTGEAKTAQEAIRKLESDPPVKEFPENYPDQYFVSKSGKIYKVETLDISKSKDKFIVQYQDPALAGKGKIQVTLEIKNPKNPNSPYKERVKINLTEDKSNPGTFRSQDLVLVSAKFMDEKQINAQKDNSPKDQTFLAELGSEISISYQDNISGKIHTESASVHVKKMLQVPVFIFKDKNGTALANQAQVDKHAIDAQEVWSPAGIKIKVNEPILLDFPPGVDISDGLDSKESEACIRYINEKYPNNPGARWIFAGDKFPNSETTGAYAITQKDPYSVMHGLYNNIFLKSEWMLSETTGHEIAHCLLDSVKKGPWKSEIYDADGHAYNPSNIMGHHTTYDTKDITVFGRRNLSNEQIDMALKAPQLQDLPQENLTTNSEKTAPTRSIFDEPREVQAAHREGLHMVPQP